MTVDVRRRRAHAARDLPAAVRGGGQGGHVGSVMCSYNRLNGQYACENHAAADRRPQARVGLQGLRARRLRRGRTAPTAVAQQRPGLRAVARRRRTRPRAGAAPRIAAGPGRPRPQVDEHVRRILRTLFAFGFFDRAGLPRRRRPDRQGRRTRATAQRIEERRSRCSRNRRRALPLDAPQAAVDRRASAPDADRFVTGGGSGNVTPFTSITPRQAHRARVPAPGVKVTLRRRQRRGARGRRWPRRADVAVVVAADYQTEGADRAVPDARVPARRRRPGRADRRRSRPRNPNTVVVLETGGPVLTPWRDQVGALLEAWYPGEEGGAAIARVLFGDADPGGRLPGHLPAAARPTAADRRRPARSTRASARRRHLQGGRARRLPLVRREGPAPGLPVRLRPVVHDVRPARRPQARAAGGGAGRGGRPGAQHGPARGHGRGAALPGPPDGAAASRRASSSGSRACACRRGGTATARVRLDRTAFRTWDARRHAWVVRAGRYRLWAGTSSRGPRAPGRRPGRLTARAAARRPRAGPRARRRRPRPRRSAPAGAGPARPQDGRRDEQGQRRRSRRRARRPGGSRS